jgi:hypothetical protein
MTAMNSLVNGGVMAMLLYFLGSYSFPVPLYSGTTFVSLHAYGGLASMAVTFKNLVIHSIPSDPKCFSIYSGILLRPLLLLALNLFWIIVLSSAVVI